MRQTVLISTILLAALVISGCKDDNPASPSTGSAPYSATDLRVGTGTEATAGRRVVVNYTGSVALILLILFLWYLFVKWNERTNRCSAF